MAPSQCRPPGQTAWVKPPLSNTAASQPRVPFRLASSQKLVIVAPARRGHPPPALGALRGVEAPNDIARHQPAGAVVVDGDPRARCCCRASTVRRCPTPCRCRPARAPRAASSAATVAISTGEDAVVGGGGHRWRSFDAARRTRSHRARRARVRAPRVGWADRSDRTRCCRRARRRRAPGRRGCARGPAARCHLAWRLSRLRFRAWASTSSRARRVIRGSRTAATVARRRRGCGGRGAGGRASRVASRSAAAARRWPGRRRRSRFRPRGRSSRA